MTVDRHEVRTVGAKTATLKGSQNSDDQTGIPGLSGFDRWFAPRPWSNWQI